MTTKAPRINVTFDQKMADLLSTLAGKEKKSVSGLVRELAIEALERREDFYLSKVAMKRSSNDAIRHSHEDAWL